MVQKKNLKLKYKRMFFPEDTSMAAKIGIFISAILVVLVTLLWYDTKKKYQKKQPDYYYTTRENRAFTGDETMEIKSFDRTMVGKNEQSEVKFLDECKKYCYYHPECIAVVAEKDDGDFDDEVTKCSLRAHNFFKGHNKLSDVHFIKRNKKAGMNPKQREVIRDGMLEAYDKRKALDDMKKIQTSESTQAHAQATAATKAGQQSHHEVPVITGTPVV
jgi:hypothetical protein